MSIKRKFTKQNSMSAIENYEYSREADVHKNGLIVWKLPIPDPRIEDENELLQRSTSVRTRPKTDAQPVVIFHAKPDTDTHREKI